MAGLEEDHHTNKVNTNC